MVCTGFPMLAVRVPLIESPTLKVSESTSLRKLGEFSMRMVTRKRSHDAEPSTTRRLTKTIHYNHRLVGSTTKTTGVEDEVIRPWIAVKLLERTKEIVDLMLLK